MVSIEPDENVAHRLCDSPLAVEAISPNLGTTYWWGFCIQLTPYWQGSYPPLTWVAESATLSGLMFGSMVSLRTFGEVVNPGNVSCFSYPV